MIKIQQLITVLSVFLLCNDLSVIVTAQDTVETSTTNTKTTTKTKAEKKPYVIRWTSSGGGWRATFANLGFFNAFVKAGIVNINDSTTNITGISSNSGTSWFIGQLAYSQDFFTNAITPDDTNSIYQFTLDWMNAFGSFTATSVQQFDTEMAQLEMKSKAEQVQVQQFQQQQKNNNTGRNQANIQEPKLVWTPIFNGKRLLLEACKLIPFDAIFEEANDISSLCKLFVRIDFAWGQFVQEMFEATATSNAFNDPDFLNKKATAENRIPIFQNTDLMFQTAIMPTSKVVSNAKLTWWQRLLARLNPLNPYGTRHLVTYIGPAHDKSIVFTTPIATQYTVSTNGGGTFRYAVEDHMLPLQTYTGNAPKTFNFFDYDVYYYFNAFTESTNRGGTVFTLLPHGRDIANSRKVLQQPFKDDASILQVMAASSSGLADNTGSIPSYLAQRYSIRKWNIEQSNKSQTEKNVDILNLQSVIDVVYNSNFINNLAFCSSWSPPGKKPNGDRNAHPPCTKSDTRIIDGSVSDGPALAMNIGLYHSQNPTTYKDVTLKVILTNVNFIGDRNANLLAYFSTYFNQGITPGDWIWAPGVLTAEEHQRAPYRSMQIFNEYMDDKLLEKPLRTVDIQNTNILWNVTSAIYKCTTIENKPFHVLPGQDVEILLFRINSRIPTTIISPSAIQQYKVPMAEQTQYIAQQPEIVTRIQQFLDM